MPPHLSLHALILDRIRLEGPLTFAAFMELALYHPGLGYYARATRRSGRGGDFFTSVDVGPMFGEALAVQVGDCWSSMDRPPAFDLVEVAAGDGRLLSDVLDALQARAPDCYAAVRAHLVERSAAALEAQHARLAAHAACVRSSAEDLPPSIRGVVFANELLDAMPAHLVVMTTAGLRERYVDERDGRLCECIGPLSTEALTATLARAGVQPPAGWCGEVSLAAVAWMRQLAARLAVGFAVLFDYGHEAAALADAPHTSGTLMAYTRHMSLAGVAACLEAPGERDITTHVNLTVIRAAAADAGLTPLALMDQTYFLLGTGAAERAAQPTGDGLADLKRRLALKSLAVPGGLGSTMKVMIFGRGVGTPPLAAASRGSRLT